MKIALLIPDRNDRPEFLANCLRMMERQTLQPAHIEIMNDPPISAEKDITWRYRHGYERLRGKGYDVIALIENDDWYAPHYLETISAEWLKAKKPDLCGTGSTIYYHIMLRKYYTMNHPRRASAMNTLIRPDMKIHWCEDAYAYTDLHLWNMTIDQPPRKACLTGHIFTPDRPIALGIKHGVGLCGGISHVNRLERYNISDENFDFLRGTMDVDSFEFYSNYFTMAAARP